LDINGIKSMKLDDFVADADKYSRLWILAPNPVFSVSGDIDLASAMAKIGDVVYLSQYDDETAYHSNWTVPACHPLESWGDVRAMDGTYSVCQPTIAPLLGGKTASELLVMLAGLSVDDLPANVVISDTAPKLFGTDTTVKRSNEQLANLRKMREALHAGFLASSESKLCQRASGAGSCGPTEGGSGWIGQGPQLLATGHSAIVRDGDFEFGSIGLAKRHCLRRASWEQWMVARMSASGHQVDMGQRCDLLSCDGRRTGA
jgi:hypothetical protein